MSHIYMCLNKLIHVHFLYLEKLLMKKKMFFLLKESSKF